MHARNRRGPKTEPCGNPSLHSEPGGRGVVNADGLAAVLTGSIQARHELVHERRNDEVWPGDPCAQTRSNAFERS